MERTMAIGTFYREWRGLVWDEPDLDIYIYIYIITGEPPILLGKYSACRDEIFLIFSAYPKCTTASSISLHFFSIKIVI